MNFPKNLPYKNYLLALLGGMFLMPAVSLAQAPIVQPGAPGAPGRTLSAEEAIEIAVTAYSPADIRFLKDMIPHHHQATEIAAANLADQGLAFNPQQQLRVTWPAEPVVARAYIEQLQRTEELSVSIAQDLAEALDEAEDKLVKAKRSRRLASKLELLASAVQKGESNATTLKRKADLAGTLTGMAGRLRE